MYAVTVDAVLQLMNYRASLFVVTRRHFTHRININLTDGRTFNTRRDEGCARLLLLLLLLW